tara:strand:- start:11405 stop:14269 length:2865 start_codon:yes stop_codon:yes gene_type:complete
MSEAHPGSDDVEARLASLAKFGFPHDEMVAFLSEHEGGTHERLAWLEQRRETAAELDERFRAIERGGRADEGLRALHSALNNPFTVEASVVEFERHLRGTLSWEPPLSRSKSVWFEAGNGNDWDNLFTRLMNLDVSSLPAVVPLHRLFESPERLDEIVRHLRTIEADETRQRQLIEAGAERLREHGYPVGDLGVRPLLEGLQDLERWQTFHAKREHVRLAAVQLIQPFDPDLATEFEQRCNGMQNVEQASELDALTDEIQALAQALEQRRQVLSDAIHAWRAQGIVFPHEGDLHPNDLMAWEANHDTVAASVERHLALVERWNRFARHWPAQTAASETLLGHLDRTEELQDVVDEMDGLWKQLELDGLALLESYEHAGLDVSAWRQRVFDDPMNAMERMTVARDQWDTRVSLMNELNALDTSFSGQEDTFLRLQLLASEDVDAEVLEEMQGHVLRAQRRSERHRVMLNEELAALRRAGVLEHEISTDQMNLRELETHVANLTRSNGAANATTHNGVMLERMRTSVEQELNALHEQGWHVEEWRTAVKGELVRVARELSEARPHLLRHDVLRRRLAALPWNRHVDLALSVEAMCQQPHRLAYLNQQIPVYTTLLSTRPVEDESYTLSLWMPVEKHPTLIPVPEDQDRKVLQPATTLDDAHEAMLEAMDDKSATDTEEDKPLRSNEEQPGEALSEKVEVSPEREAITSLSGSPSPPEPVETEEEQPVATRGAVEEDAHAGDVPVEDAPEMEEEQLTATPGAVEEDAPAGDAIVEDAPAEEVREVEVVPSGKGTAKALNALTELVALLGLPDEALAIEQREMEAIPDLRRRLAAEVNISPRDVRVGRLLRLTLRLLPQGDGDDASRAKMLSTLCELVAPLKRWMRRRLEARHSGAGGEFLTDAAELGVALERIPGLGHHLPLDLDDWPLPSDINELSEEVAKLARSVHLPSAGGVKA